MRNCRGGFAVVLQGFVLLAQFFVGLAHHALDKRIVLVRLLKLLQCRFVISCIERDVAFQIREERRLLRNGALVENGFCRSNMLLRIRLVAAPLVTEQFPGWSELQRIHIQTTAKKSRVSEVGGKVAIGGLAFSLRS